jgi:Fe2+ transport system protein FeoA
MKVQSMFNMTLAELPVGRPAWIVGLGGVEEERSRLEAMGLCAGRSVDVVKGGDPMIVRVLGTRIGIAGALAARVGVEDAGRDAS